MSKAFEHIMVNQLRDIFKAKYGEDCILTEKEIRESFACRSIDLVMTNLYERHKNVKR